MWTSRAPACRSIGMNFAQRGPRTSESSIRTIRLPCSSSATGLNLILTPKCRMDCPRLDKRPANVVAAHQRHLERQAASRHSRARRRYPSLAPARRYRRRRAFARERSSLLLTHRIDVAAVEQAVGPREVDVLEDAAAGGPARTEGDRPYSLVGDRRAPRPARAHARIRRGPDRARKSPRSRSERH